MTPWIVKTYVVVHQKKDECGVCNGPGVDYDNGFCDCWGNKTDVCGVCGGSGVPPGWKDCNTPPDEGEDNTHDPVVAEEAKKRVEDEGGMYEGTTVRATLLWENCNDLDLHVVEPDGSYVWFDEPMSDNR